MSLFARMLAMMRRPAVRTTRPELAAAHRAADQRPASDAPTLRRADAVLKMVDDYRRQDEQFRANGS